MRNVVRGAVRAAYVDGGRHAGGGVYCAAAAGAGVGGGVGTWIGNNAFNLIYGEEVNQAKLGSMWADQEKRLNAYSQLALIARGNGNVANVRDALFNKFNLSSCSSINASISTLLKSFILLGIGISGNFVLGSVEVVCCNCVIA